VVVVLLLVVEVVDAEVVVALLEVDQSSEEVASFLHFHLEAFPFVAPILLEEVDDASVEELHNLVEPVDLKVPIGCFADRIVAGGNDCSLTVAVAVVDPH